MARLRPARFSPPIAQSLKPIVEHSLHSWHITSMLKSKSIPAAEQSLGLRERNKIDKQRRIREAARELFIAKGFDDATTREIAVRAGVGIGTVFTYADNKRDLLFLVANDDLAQVTRTARDSIRKDASCLHNLISFFRNFYEFYALEPELSRMMLREMTFYDAGQQVVRFQENRMWILELICEIVALAVEQKALRTKEDSSFIGWVIFAVFQVEARQWLRSTENLDVETGIKRLRRALTVVLKGADPTPAALKAP